MRPAPLAVLLVLSPLPAAYPASEVFADLLIVVFFSDGESVVIVVCCRG